MSRLKEVATIQYHGKIYHVMQEPISGEVWFRDENGYDTSVGKVSANTKEEACEIVRKMLESLGY